MSAGGPAPRPGVKSVAEPEIALRVRRLLVTSLHLEGLDPESIDEDRELFGPGLGLDSVDVLELVVALEREFGIVVLTEEVGREAFRTVRTLSKFVAGRLAAKEDSHG